MERPISLNDELPHCDHNSQADRENDPSRLEKLLVHVHMFSPLKENPFSIRDCQSGFYDATVGAVSVVLAPI